MKEFVPAYLRELNVVLASRSPRRQELFRFLTEKFTVKASHFDESGLMADDTLTPEQLVEALSAGKAEAVFHEMGEPEDSLVVGGDTVVVSPEGKIFGIPRDREDAGRMIAALSGRVHRVVTGMTLCAKGKESSFAVSTDVEFYPLSDEEISGYLDTGESFDKAGAYGIQGYGSVLVKGISGSYDNVVGLPVAELSRNLKKFCQK